MTKRKGLEERYLYVLMFCEKLEVFAESVTVLRGGERLKRYGLYG